MIGRFFFDADDDHLAGWLLHAPELEQQTQTRVFLEIERKPERAEQQSQQPDDQSPR